jgi:hypothetical protein
MRRGIIMAVMVGAILNITGCAAILSGTNTKVKFSSEPTAAAVLVNGSPVGKTPMALSLESKKPYNITFKKEGYEDDQYLLTSSLEGGWIVLDILCGLVPIIVDAATGAWYGLDTSHVHGYLEKKGE